MDPRLVVRINGEERLEVHSELSCSIKTEAIVMINNLLIVFLKYLFALQVAPPEFL